MRKTSPIAASFLFLLASTALAQTGASGGGATGGFGAGGAGAMSPGGGATGGATSGPGAGGAGVMIPGRGGTSVAPGSTTSTPGATTAPGASAGQTQGVATVPQTSNPPPAVIVFPPGPTVPDATVPGSGTGGPVILRGGGSSGGVIRNPGATDGSAAGTTDAGAGAATLPGTMTAPGAPPPSSMIGSAPPGSAAIDDTSNVRWRAIAQNWRAHSGEVRRRWALLTSQDVEAVSGVRANLVRALQQRYGISPAQAEIEVQAFERR